MGRRDKNDEEWKRVKEIVQKRDKGICRFLRILTPSEMKIFKKSLKGASVGRLDPAHIIAVGHDIRLCYDPDNIVLLCRVAHDRIDNMRSPLTGEIINADQQKAWWKRIKEG